MDVKISYLDSGVHFLVFIFSLVVVRPELLLWIIHVEGEGKMYIVNNPNKETLLRDSQRPQLRLSQPGHHTPDSRALLYVSSFNLF